MLGQTNKLAQTQQMAGFPKYLHALYFLLAFGPTNKTEIVSDTYTYTYIDIYIKTQIYIYIYIYIYIVS